MAKFTCPYCLQEYRKGEVLYECPVCRTKTRKSWLQSLFVRGAVKCSHIENDVKCSGVAAIIKCPKCDNELPKTALETPNLPFSIVGASSSGKTNYITVMLHELANFPGLRLSLSHQDRATLEHQNENYRKIYEEHIVPEATPAGERMPQIWCIKNLQAQKHDSTPTYTFTIFDGAGEDHEIALDQSSTVCRYISSSKAILITLDPLILSNVRKWVAKDVREHAGGGAAKNAVDVVNSLANYIKSARGIRADKKIQTPAAIILTKFDTLLQHPNFAPNALIKQSCMTVRDGHVSDSEIQQIDEEIRRWLEDINERAFLDAIESNFTDFCYFGVSSYGKSPEIGGRTPQNIKPHRVLDPILWLFLKAGFID